MSYLTRILVGVVRPHHSPTDSAVPMDDCGNQLMKRRCPSLMMCGDCTGKERLCVGCLCTYVVVVSLVLLHVTASTDPLLRGF